MSSRPATKKASRNPRAEHLASLERGLRVLALFGTDGVHEFTMTEVAERLSITRASAMRLLATLERLGFVHSFGRSYRLGVRVLTLGYAYLSSLGFSTVAHPIVEALMRETGETCSIGVLDGHEVVYVVRAEARRIVRIDLSVGSRLPAYLNSMGRLLLGALPADELEAYLEALEPTAVTRRTVTDKQELKKRIIATRRLGWCYINGEVEERVAGLSVPLRGRLGQAIAALNVTLMRERHSRHEIKTELLPKLTGTARQIEQLLHSGVPLS